MRSALITGAAVRLGKNFAHFLAENGFNIALHYNNSKKEAIELKKKLNDQGIKCNIYKADLSKEKEVKKLFEKVLTDFNDLELLINNASIFIKSTFMETSSSLFDKTFNINFKAPFILSQCFARNVKKGLIINILDAKIRKNSTSYFAYLLSKKLLFFFTKMAAKELAPNIRVNGIAPGVVLPPQGKDEEYLAPIIKKIPLGRKASFEELNNTLLFLINNEYITGEVIFVDGGESL